MTGKYHTPTMPHCLYIHVPTIVFITDVSESYTQWARSLGNLITVWVKFRMPTRTIQNNGRLQKHILKLLKTY